MDMHKYQVQSHTVRHKLKAWTPLLIHSFFFFILPILNTVKQTEDIKTITNNFKRTKKLTKRRYQKNNFRVPLFTLMTVLFTGMLLN